MEDTLLKDPLNADICALLLFSNLTRDEKELWIDLLPHMKTADKEALQINLRKEIAYERKVEEDALKQFVASFNKGI